MDCLGCPHRVVHHPLPIAAGKRKHYCLLKKWKRIKVKLVIGRAEEWCPLNLRAEENLESES